MKERRREGGREKDSHDRSTDGMYSTQEGDMDVYNINRQTIIVLGVSYGEMDRCTEDDEWKCEDESEREREREREDWTMNGEINDERNGGLELRMEMKMEFGVCDVHGDGYNGTMKDYTIDIWLFHIDHRTMTTVD